jgi:hypothetical protein
MADTIREFVASLGFQLDETSQRKFTDALTGATLQAKLLGDALEATARTVVDKVGEVAAEFENLYYATQRTGASVQSIRAFEYAVSQLGGTAAAAGSALEQFGRHLRVDPGFRQWVTQALGVQTQINGVARDNAEVLLDIGQRLNAMPKYLADRYKEILGVDEPTLLAIEKATEVRKRCTQSLQSQGNAGLGPQAAKDAVAFEQVWREAWGRIGDMAAGGETKLLGALTKPIEDFDTFLSSHGPQIDRAMTDLATAVGQVATQWEADVEKIDLEKTAKDFEDTAHSVADFVRSLSTFISSMEDLNERSKNWPLMRLIDQAASGASVTPLPSGPGFMASHGPGVEFSDVGAPAADNWWRAHMPTWLGGQNPADLPSRAATPEAFEDGFRIPGDTGSGGKIAVDGAPISASNPMPVNLVAATGSGGWFDAVKSFFGLGGSTGSGGEVGASGLGPGSGGRGGGAAGGSNAQMDSRAMQLMDRLIQVHGWTPEAAAIAAGNAQQESGVRSNGPMGDPSTPGGSWGMMQWNRERLTALKAFASSRGASWQDFNTQADFLDQEARSKIPTWPSQRGLGLAGTISHEYEGYGDNSTGTREANSARFLKLYDAMQKTAANQRKYTGDHGNFNVPSGHRSSITRQSLARS